jgi:CheY-like chemotaxis protein
VIEDNALVLNTVRMILENANFNVLGFASADDAIQISGYVQTIDLLLSDVTLPDMSGSDLALKLKESRPEMQVMLMSPYHAGGSLALDHGGYFVQELFIPGMDYDGFVAKIKELCMESCATTAQIIATNTNNSVQRTFRIYACSATVLGAMLLNGAPRRPGSCPGR